MVSGVNTTTAGQGVRLHVVTGKGGTGKTTVAAALALRWPRKASRKVLLAEVEERQGISSDFRHRPLVHEETPDPQRPLGRRRALWACRSSRRPRSWSTSQKFYKLGRAGRRCCEKVGAVDFATTIAPGVRDVLLIGKVYEAVRAHPGTAAQGGRLAV
jgi:CO dehydrogenase nickel-insertion accessory protein CooC1